MNRIRELREKANVSQRELAEHLNVTQGTLSSWETGRYRPNPDTLRQLADYFDVSIDHLLMRDKERTRAEDALKQLEELCHAEPWVTLTPEEARKQYDVLAHKLRFYEKFVELLREAIWCLTYVHQDLLYEAALLCLDGKKKEGDVDEAHTEQAYNTCRDTDGA